MPGSQSLALFDEQKMPNTLTYVFYFLTYLTNNRSFKSLRPLILNIYLFDNDDDDELFSKNCSPTKGVEYYF